LRRRFRLCGRHLGRITDIPIVSGVLIGDRDVLTVAHGIFDAEGNEILFDTTFGPDVEARAVLYGERNFPVRKTTGG
jgi:hypothetical protein